MTDDRQRHQAPEPRVRRDPVLELRVHDLLRNAAQVRQTEKEAEQSAAKDRALEAFKAVQGC